MSCGSQKPDSEPLSSKVNSVENTDFLVGFLFMVLLKSSGTSSRVTDKKLEWVGRILCFDSDCALPNWMLVEFADSITKSTP